MKIKLDGHGIMPTRAHATDAGLDLYSPCDVTIGAGRFRKIDTGVHVQLPKGTAGFIKSKSGLMSKHGITTDGTVDEGYTGSIGVVLFNGGNQSYRVKQYDRIAQLVVVPVLYPTVEVSETLEGSERGNNGFGSTGR